jgi:hypothetical protein
MYFEGILEGGEHVSLAEFTTPTFLFQGLPLPHRSPNPKHNIAPDNENSYPRLLDPSLQNVTRRVPTLTHPHFADSNHGPNAGADQPNPEAPTYARN